MYFYLHRNFKKWTFYNVKILKCETFVITLCRNSKKWTFLLHKIVKSRPFLIQIPHGSLKVFKNMQSMKSL